MFCEKPEEKNMLEALKTAYPHASEYVLDLNVWMYFNKRDEYIAIMDDLMAKNSDPENPEFISIDDERLRAIYPKEVKIIPPPQSENEPEPEVLAE